MAQLFLLWRMVFFVISVASCSWNLNDHLYIFYAWGPIQLLQNIEIKIPLTFPLNYPNKRTGTVASELINRTTNDILYLTVTVQSVSVNDHE